MKWTRGAPKTVREPVGNLTPEAVALRRAAVAFSRHVADLDTAGNDARGRALNLGLLQAAVDYTAVATGQVLVVRRG